MVYFGLVFQLFALLNPLSSVPFLLQAHNKKMNVKIIALKAVITAFSIAFIMVLLGKYIFDMFGISLDSFRVAGGVVLFLLGLSMVRPKDENNKKSDSSIDGLITIIATPMLTGPGVISFVTLKTFEMGKTIVLINLIVGFILVGIVFMLFSIFIDRINVKLINITSRILGLFLTAVSIEMIAKGLEGIIRAAI
ncbi:MAG: MarC family protein [Nanoarchaeota archaeon]|nr:MarC family protein [Nanoarchaeota archaeon]